MKKYNSFGKFMSALLPCHLIGRKYQHFWPVTWWGGNVSTSGLSLSGEEITCWGETHMSGEMTQSASVRMWKLLTISPVQR